jgi:hypothetical protein
MNMKDRDISLVIGHFKDANITGITLDVMRQIIDRGLSSELVANLISIQLSPNRVQAIYKVMESLEKLADTDRSVACILMSDLWGFASDERMHDTCDAIDLWLSNAHSVELRLHLKELASSESDPNKRRHFNDLAGN